MALVTPGRCMRKEGRETGRAISKDGYWCRLGWRGVLQIGCRHVCDAWLGITCHSWLPTSIVLTIKIERLCPPAVAVIVAPQSLLLSAVQHSLVKARYHPIRPHSSPAKDKTGCCSRPSFSLPLRPMRLPHSEHVVLLSPQRRRLPSPSSSTRSNRRPVSQETPPRRP